MSYNRVCIIALALIVSANAIAQSNEQVDVVADGQLYIITPKYVKPTHTLVWLHGLGENSTVYVDFWVEYLSKHTPALRIVLPTASVKNVTAFKSKMPSWFDMVRFNFKYNEVAELINKQEARDSAGLVRRYINKAIAYHRNDPSKVFIGGFSQGGWMSFLVGFSFPRALAGIISIGGVVPPFTRESLPSATTPALVYVGQDDEYIPYQTVVDSIARFKNGKRIVVEKYPQNGKHAFTKEHNVMLNSFISDVMFNRLSRQ